MVKMRAATVVVFLLVFSALFLAGCVQTRAYEQACNTSADCPELSYCAVQGVSKACVKIVGSVGSGVNQSPGIPPLRQHVCGNQFCENSDGENVESCPEDCKLSENCVSDRDCAEWQVCKEFPGVCSLCPIRRDGESLNCPCAPTKHKCVGVGAFFSVRDAHTLLPIEGANISLVVDSWKVNPAFGNYSTYRFTDKQGEAIFEGQALRTLVNNDNFKVLATVLTSNAGYLQSVDEFEYVYPDRGFNVNISLVPLDGVATTEEVARSILTSNNVVSAWLDLNPGAAMTSISLSKGRWKVQYDRESPKQYNSFTNLRLNVQVDAYNGSVLFHPCPGRAEAVRILNTSGRFYFVTSHTRFEFSCELPDEGCDEFRSSEGVMVSLASTFYQSCFLESFNIGECGLLNPLMPSRYQDGQAIACKPLVCVRIN